ncbi:TPA: four helix bundle protein [Candidatus Beckwithbacteria bacterium]|nr:MAG: S23 ribosomal protein [Candidatus Beckwithbacteria bacterium GW2011_GWC1_49_16]HAF63400.1 four helix bundle protein [Candidatus Beckwithbacteria bacterium]HAV66636.1 four helix bundle protein [Candidatus Beckwithbacteria bacterium]HBU22279.1 four helix bundle protein [Candidatus Beckwithbacteria bacterium]HCF00153.1 four helix bundle protein [Candidatus Beckwithbacteria bacterium]
MINNFDKLDAWKKAHGLALKIYKLAENFPRTERFGLVSQICRAASSVPANIVEGNSRQSKKEYAQFLFQAKGSLSEVQYFLILARDLKFISDQQAKELMNDCDDVSRLIAGLIKYLRKG